MNMHHLPQEAICLRGLNKIYSKRESQESRLMQARKWETTCHTSTNTIQNATHIQIQIFLGIRVYQRPNNIYMYSM